jgi:hypothetical protein
MNFEKSIKYLVAVLLKTRFSIAVSEDDYIIEYFPKETKEATIKIILEYIESSNTFCFKKETDPINSWREFVTGDLSLVIKAIEKEYDGIILWIRKNDETWNDKILRRKEDYFLYDILTRNPILPTEELKKHYQTIKNNLILNSKKMEKQKTIVDVDLIDEKNERTLNLCLSALNQLTSSMEDLVLEEDAELRKSMSDTAQVLADTVSSILIGAKTIPISNPEMTVKKNEEEDKSKNGKPVTTPIASTTPKPGASEKQTEKEDSSLKKTNEPAKGKEAPTMLYTEKDGKNKEKKPFDPEIVTASLQEKFHAILDPLATENKPLEVPIDKADAIRVFIGTSYPQNHEIRKEKNWVTKIYDMWLESVIADIKEDTMTEFNKDEVSDDEMAKIAADAATISETTNEEDASEGKATDDVVADEAEIVETKTPAVNIPANTKTTTAADFKKVETKTPAALTFTKLGSVDKEKNWAAISSYIKQRYTKDNIGEVGTFIKTEEKWVRVDIRNKTWGEGKPEGNSAIGSKDEINKRLSAIYDEIKKAS